MAQRRTNVGATGRTARAVRGSRKFAVVDELFGEPIAVQRSLYFTMAAKTFYTQGGESTIQTTEIGSVRLDLDTGEALATVDLRPVVEGGLSVEAQEQAEAQLEVFRQAVERLFNKRHRSGGPRGKTNNPYRRKGRPKVEGARVEGAEGVPSGDFTRAEGGDLTVTADEIDQKFAVRDKVKAKRERDAALKREKRAAALEAKRAAQEGQETITWKDINGSVDATASSDAELDALLDGTHENDPDPSEYEQGTDEQWAAYAEPQGSEGPVTEGALG
jgi:hypothetical protein